MSRRSEQPGSGRHSRRERDSTRGDNGPIERLEEAVEDLVAVARDQFSETAAKVVEETTVQLKAAVSSETSDSDPDDEHRSRGRRGRSRSRSRRRGRRCASAYRRSRSARNDRERSRDDEADYADYEEQSREGLYLNPYDAWIGGVCGGFAQYFNMEVWVTRLIFISVFLFQPPIVLLVYISAWIFMDNPPRPETDLRRKKRARPDIHAADAPELGPQRSPRRSLKNAKAHFDALELRLRRLESFVTSDRFEMRRELYRL